MRVLISRYRVAVVCSIAILAFYLTSSWLIWSALSLASYR
jgi:hypothetical protein